MGEVSDIDTIAVDHRLFSWLSFLYELGLNKANPDVKDALCGFPIFGSCEQEAEKVPVPWLSGVKLDGRTSMVDGLMEVFRRPGSC